jgi:hypothetical protein
MYGHRTKTYGFFGDFIANRNITGTVKDILIGEPRDEFTIGEAPFMTMEKPEVQQMFQELWDSGFRPEINKDSAGAYEAQGKHLADMQKIAFMGLDEMKKRLNPSYLIMGSSGNDHVEIEES